MSLVDPLRGSVIVDNGNVSIQELASVGSVLVGLGGIAVGLLGLRLARLMSGQAERQAQAQEAAIEMERRMKMGAVPVITFAEGWTAGDGRKCVVVGVANAAPNPGWSIYVHNAGIHVGPRVIRPRTPWLVGEIVDGGWTGGLSPLTETGNLLRDVASAKHLALAFLADDLEPLMVSNLDSPLFGGRSSLVSIPGAEFQLDLVEPLGDRSVRWPLRSFPFRHSIGS